MGLNLGDDVHEVVASWLSRKDPIPEGWKVEMSPTCPMSFSDLQKLGIPGCSNLVSRAWRNTSRLKALSELLGALASAIQVESTLAQTNYEAVSNMSSLITLPSELLGRIFEYVVKGQETPARWKAAVALSHVNQYFRSAALTCPQLWKNINRTANTALSLSRSKGAFLDIELVVTYSLRSNPESYDVWYEDFLPDILPHSKRWRSLHIQFTEFRSPENEAMVEYVKPPNTGNPFSKIDVCSLTSLCIDGDQQYASGFKDYSGFHLWNAPELVHVRTRRFILPSHFFPPIVNITNLDITHDLAGIDLGGFIQDLGRMEVLEDLALNLESEAHLNNVELWEMVELRSVRRLRIRIWKGWHPAESPDTSLLSVLRFPNALNLHIIARGYIPAKHDYQHEQLDPVVMNLCSHLESLLQNDEQFPLVEHFRLEVKALVSEGFSKDSVYWFEPQQAEVALSLPLNLLPNLKHFTLCCNRSVLISDEDIKYTARAYFTTPKIETVAIRIPSEYSLFNLAKFIEELLEEQIKRGNWGYFRELVVIDVELDEEASDCQKERNKRTYEGRDALVWCARPRTFSDEDLTRFTDEESNLGAGIDVDG